MRNAFTLIELLVVIGVIAILMAVILAALPIVTDGANKATCTSNMKQIGGALLTYASDHDGVMAGYGNHVTVGPPPVGQTDFWLWQVLNQLGEGTTNGNAVPQGIYKAVQCPANATLDFMNATYLARTPVTYAISTLMSGEAAGGSFSGVKHNGHYRSLKLGKIRTPGRFLMLVEANAGAGWLTFGKDWAQAGALTDVQQMQGWFAHNAKSVKLWRETTNFNTTGYKKFLTARMNVIMADGGKVELSLDELFPLGSQVEAQEPQYQPTQSGRWLSDAEKKNLFPGGL